MHFPEPIDPIKALAQCETLRVQFESAIARTRSHAGMLSVLCVDLADLRSDAATNPEWEGSQAAGHLAERVRRCARRGDLVAALNDHVCVVVAEFVQGPHAARRMADRILNALKMPSTRQASNASRGARIGIATASGAQLEGEHPLRRAHRAMLRTRYEHGQIIADASD